MFVERLQLSPKERYEQFNRRYPGLINRVKLKYVAAFLGISIYTLSRVRAKNSSRPVFFAFKQKNFILQAVSLPSENIN